MTTTAFSELQVKPKQEVSSNAEQTTPGPIFTPDVDIYETEQGITLLADLPGVESGDLAIDLKDGVLTISGEVNGLSGDGENGILTEYETGRYFRQFTLSNIIDQAKIDAKLNDGVLTLSLPKVEKATPRKIEVKTA